MRRVLMGLILWLGCSASVLAEPMLMTTGTWALAVRPDVFASAYPILSYLPAGTIVFDTAPATYNSRHVLVLTQHGFWLQIRNSGNGGPVLEPLGKWSIAIPSKVAFFHRSVLCLSETNEIIEPDEKCEIGLKKDPVGEGWLFQYDDKADRPNWINMRASFDDNTKAQLAERGWDVAEANFDMKIDDLLRLEERGLVTTLDRKYPIVSIDNREIEPVLLGCGKRTVTSEELRAGISAKASAEARASFLGWLKAKLGIEADIAAEAARVSSIELSTRSKSFMYYAVRGIVHDSDEEFSIRVEKEFDCTSDARVDFGDKITAVTFDVEYFGGSDPLSFRFDDPSQFISMPEEIYDVNNKRPIFVSINNGDHYLKSVGQVMRDIGIPSRWLAEYVLASINYSCPSAQRDACARLQGS